MPRWPPQSVAINGPPRVRLSDMPGKRSCALMVALANEVVVTAADGAMTIGLAVPPKFQLVEELTPAFQSWNHGEAVS